MTDQKPLPAISIIVAIARNGAIGLNNQLLWHIPEDFKWFKKHALGHPVIMGRNTYLSLPVRPLPKRKNIVITDRSDDDFPGAVCVGSFEEAMREMVGGEENFIIGGGSVYRQFLPVADRLYLTVIDRDYEADTFFPEIPSGEWKEVFREEHPVKDPAHPGFTFYILERKR